MLQCLWGSNKNKGGVGLFQISSLTSWRRLEDVFRLRLWKTSSRRRDQDEYVRLSLTSSEDVLVKTNIFVLAIRLQDVFKTSCRKVFKTSSRRFEDVFKKSSRHLQDVFKTYHQVKLFLLTCLWEAFNTFLRRSFRKTIIYRGIFPGNTTSDKFMVSVQNLPER